MSVLARICCIFTLVFNPTFFGFAKREAFQSFKVVVYNVENLFDVDDVSLYDDYRMGMYGINELENKLDAIVSVLKKIGGESGPDIILLQEIEVDRTPKKNRSATEELLRELKLHGLGPYEYRLGYDPKNSPDSWPSVHCLTLSKFPITESRLHQLERARPILETTHLIDGQSFTLFNNHWKSGASSPKMEILRIQNAEVLRKRIDEILKQDPTIDFLVGGDLNSHYNQSTVYRNVMDRTGINDVLHSTGTEPPGKSNGGKLYNLWHELEPDERGSDAWRGKWGTLMHILLPDTLYDTKGVHYVTDSFQVESWSRHNKIEGLEIPFKWSNELNGFGTSDHFPLSAQFITNGGRTAKGKNYTKVETNQRSIDYEGAKKNASFWNQSKLNPKNFGKTFYFTGIVSKKKPFCLKINELEMGIYSFDSQTKESLFSHSIGEKISCYGYLSRYRGNWQFIVAKNDWID